MPVGPSGTFLLGTDDLGRDMLVRIAYGARISLLVGVVATALTVIGGAVVGLIAGYFGGLVDTVLARFMDWLLAIPFLLFAISLVSVAVVHPLFGIIGPGLPIVIIVIAFFGWASVGRIVRGQVLSIKEQEYVEAARALGAGPWRIMFVDILPNVLAPLIVYSTLLIPVTIVGEATLSFLGVGVQPPTADWGQMIAAAQTIYLYGAWWFLLFPSLALLITTLAFNIFGDGVRDAFDPRGDLLRLGACSGPIPDPPDPAGHLRHVAGDRRGLPDLLRRPGPELGGPDAGRQGRPRRRRWRAIAHRLLLDRPLVRAVRALPGQLLHGNLGYDYYHHEPVTTIIAAGLPDHALAGDRRGDPVARARRADRRPLGGPAPVAAGPALHDARADLLLDADVRARPAAHPGPLLRADHARHPVFPAPGTSTPFTRTR